MHLISWPHWSQLHATLPLPSLGTVRIWHSSTYRLESTLNYGMERVWCVCGLRGSNNVALGYDEGSIIIKVSGRKSSSLKIISIVKKLWKVSLFKTKISFLSLPIFLLPLPLLCRWVGRSRPCLWTLMGKSSGLNTVKSSKPTWRPWVMLRSRMERGCRWLSKTWVAVRYIPKPSSITLMEGMHILNPGTLAAFFRNSQTRAPQMLAFW